MTGQISQHHLLLFSHPVMSDSVNPWTVARQAPLLSTVSQNLLKLMSIESVMLSNHLILCHSLLLLPSIFPSIRVFCNELTLHQMAKELELQLQHQSFQWVFRVDFLSVQFSHSVMSNFLQLQGLQHARPPCLLQTPRVYSNSCPLSQWCHPAISSSVFPFSSHLQSFLASSSFPMSQFFTSGGQSIGVSASVSVSPFNEYSGLISFRIDWFDLTVQGLSRVFSNTIRWHQFFSAQASLWSLTSVWLLEKP